MKTFAASLIATMISSAVVMTFWLIGLLTSVVVYSELILQNVLMFWIVAASATVVTDWVLKSPAGDYPVDLLIISPASAIAFVVFMNTVCEHAVWFASDMFTYGTWMAILAFIVVNSLLAAKIKTWAKSKFTSE